MLQSRKGKMILAFLMSIFLWAYVTGSIDPNITKRYSHVKIQLINMDSLIAEGLAVESTDTLTIDVSLTGSRANLNKITSDDITVVADLYNRHKGNNYVSLDVELPKGIELESKSKDKILVVIDDLVTAEKDVKVDVNGELQTGMTLGETKVDPEEVTVYGTKNNVKKVDYISANINSQVFTEKESTHNVEVTPIDKKGNPVNYVTTSQNTVKVTSSLEKYKEVKLNTEIIGEPIEGYEISAIDIPEKVKVVGSEEKLNEIESVTAEPVDISGINKSQKIPLKINLPEGIKIYEEKELVASVSVKAKAKRTFNFNAGELEIRNLTGGFTARNSVPISIVLQGEESKLNAIDKEDIKIYVDVAGFTEGKHRVQIQISTVAGITAYAEPETVEITIEKEE